jgi:hypothetical protein
VRNSFATMQTGRCRSPHRLAAAVESQLSSALA